MKIFSFAVAGLIATMSLANVVEAKAAPTRSKLTSAQVEGAKAKMERDGTASVNSAPSIPAKRSCTNISCLGYATMLGVGY